jgi:hypothetical protein
MTIGFLAWLPSGDKPLQEYQFLNSIKESLKDWKALQDFLPPRLAR